MIYLHCTIIVEDDMFKVSKVHHNSKKRNNNIFKSFDEFKVWFYNKFREWKKIRTKERIEEEKSGIELEDYSNIIENISFTKDVFSNLRELNKEVFNYLKYDVFSKCLNQEEKGCFSFINN